KTSWPTRRSRRLVTAASDPRERRHSLTCSRCCSRRSISATAINLARDSRKTRSMLNDSGFSRRRFLQGAACGFGGLAWSALAQQQAASAAGGVAESATLAHGPHFPPRAKRVIFLFMQGGVSQVDSFDYKPRLAQADGQK